MTGINQQRIIEAIDLTRRQIDSIVTILTPSDYLAGNTSWKVVKTILSYTDYVNRNVWHK
jgi:UDP-N-acetylglucosamine 2-epimerase